MQDFPPVTPQAFPSFAANESLSKRARVFQLAAAVDAYEVCMARLTENWFDSRSYADAESAVWEVRSHGVALPDFSVRALELCIAHAELIALLWRQDAPNAGPQGDLNAAKMRRRGASIVLKNACLHALRFAE